MSAPHEPRCTGTKRCMKCGETKPALAFPVEKRNSDGLYSYCRDCHNVQVADTPSSKAARKAAVDKKVFIARRDADFTERGGRPAVAAGRQE